MTTMRLSEIRSELLREHQHIRSLALETLGLAEQVARREPTLQPALRERLAALETTVWSHNQREEALLDHVLPTVDAWGPERAARMCERHSLEYEATFEAVANARTPADAARTCEILASLLEQIDREEEEFLCDAVLDESSFDIGSTFGG